MKKREKPFNHNKSFMAGILSLSLLTVMAGAAVAPALGVIQAYFSDTNPLFVQMIISIPAIFIVITNFIFPRLCKAFGAKTLVMTGLLFYTAGGCVAGLFSNIALVLVMRALVGIGVGIIMPLSTGLLAFYFPPRMQGKLMGQSSAMNQMGGVVATLLSGILAGFSWRASFLVYLMGLISIVLCGIFMPDEKIYQHTEDGEKKKVGRVFRENYVYVVGMFLLMTIFFIYPSNFAMETVADGVIPQQLIAVIMAMMDFVAFIGGLTFVKARRVCKGKTKYLAPGLFLIGYLLMALLGGWAGTLIGSAMIGFANGAGIPFIISEASMKAGKSAAVTVLPLISAALYLAQFICPIIMSAVTAALGGLVPHLPYYFAALLALIFCFWSVQIRHE
ncbi:MAG: MFS transporter [Firmicutes bacterium]|nr:MFS transporter [Bacillota bacterium]